MHKEADEAKIWRWADDPSTEGGAGVFQVEVLPALAMSNESQAHWSIGQLDRAEADDLLSGTVISSFDKTVS
jgi:hypothetical protein